jgi:MEMO1 family protein
MMRPPAVAGTFYPADPQTLATTVDRLIDAVDVPDDDRLAAAYVVPHAGYRYSGPVAAHVYARLRRHAARVDRVVLIGPSHRVPLHGAAVPVTGRWRTPLGPVELDAATAQSLAAQGIVTANDTPHALEHSLEVQLPFLQRVYGEGLPTILPVGIGQSTMEQIVAVIEAAAGDGAVVLCSTDLSHYLTDAQAREQDARTAEAIVDLAPERIALRDACGVFALRGLLGWARRRGLSATVLDLRTSADTAGDPERVVGYPAVSLHTVVDPN